MKDFWKKEWNYKHDLGTIFIDFIGITLPIHLQTFSISGYTIDKWLARVKNI